MTAPFQYRLISLDKKSIRLVRLSRGEDEELRCHLFDEWLDDEDSIIEYEALSYTWGDPKKAHTILLDDCTFTVTEHLYIALAALRQSEEDRILWIDAICINQEDDQERGHQVMQMSSIYKKAESVVVWFGPSNWVTNDLMKEMQRLECAVMKHACSQWSPSDQRWLNIWLALSKDAGQSRKTNAFMQEGFLQLLASPWFERVWIIQEIAHARKARIMCGLSSISSRIFAVMPFLLSCTPDTHRQAILDVMPGPTRKHSWYAQKHDLLTLICKFRESKASDPRDRIYALLAMATETSDGIVMEPNYHKREWEVIHDAVACFMGVRNGFSLTMPLLDYTMTTFIASIESSSTDLCMAAICSGRTAVVKQLIDGGKIDLNAYRYDFEFSNIDSVLFMAAIYGHVDLFRHIIDIGQVDLTVRNKRGWTLHCLAAVYGHRELVEVLLRVIVKDGNQPAQVRERFLAQEFLKIWDTIRDRESQRGWTDRNMNDQTPIWLAVVHDHYALCKSILETCESYEETMFLGDTSLMTVAVHSPMIFGLLMQRWRVDIEAFHMKVQKDAPPHMRWSIEQSARLFYPDHQIRSVDNAQVRKILPSRMRGSIEHRARLLYPENQIRPMNNAVSQSVEWWKGYFEHVEIVRVFMQRRFVSSRLKARLQALRDADRIRLEKFTLREIERTFDHRRAIGLRFTGSWSPYYRCLLLGRWYGSNSPAFMHDAMTPDFWSMDDSTFV